MAKSKSSSKSLVSSIESVLPKGISLIHVVLAVVVGLMICSFLSESVVEGQKNQGTCSATDTKAKEEVKTTCAGLSDKQNCIEGPGCSWTDAAKQSAWTKASPTRTQLGGSAGGFCKSSTLGSAEGAVGEFCNKTKTDCGKSDLCEWITCDELDTLETEDDLNDLARCMSNNPKTMDTFKEKTFGWKTAKPYFIRKDTTDQVPNGSPLTVVPPSSAENNILEWLNCKKKQDGTTVCEGSNYVPEGLRDTIEEAIGNCEHGWIGEDSSDESKTSYENNGGKAIMGFNSDEGLVCLNSLYKKYSVELNEPKLIFSKETCPTGTCPCKPSDVRDYIEKPEIYMKVLDGLKGSVGLNAECGTDKRANDSPHYCSYEYAKNRISDIFQDGVNTGSKAVASKLDNCGQPDS